jgi:hypothetical protein
MRRRRIWIVDEHVVNILVVGTDPIPQSQLFYPLFVLESSLVFR